ncbi:tRNA (adenosine(37)-N6)-threonylcarbamoyltransferase complex ATPase subunit type 1 TsaE [Hyphobacterium sp. HN65]|uniref:tRNA threonylcarbamoyladenosine biosynthesis protein TsaE n=1 Tax=Hyphobacterium lacteum TaxID=3116575 RepID=A0ABU7LST8_9PROT|nr:tRNA (adenosine(37)-N6)-threonylcarbamoyltransferase complex ATPase subunit type 1 TsaE [Hyphobacterium sp. HN65]MEE2526935.1 tRNA (adenosine(37)-N6)-threonylcarbamoyltransferase complex ATPase subunit type 1 TsaE [Hyphobacterium sp. HN65]
MATPRSFTLDNPAATAALGERLGRALLPGDTVLLHGDLGAGKTTLARGLIKSLCDVDEVPSPTFTLMQHYDTNDGHWLVHADLYRIEEASELAELGLDDVFDNAICLIEWPDRLGSYRPDRRIDLRLTTDGETRIAEIVPAGDWGDGLDNV